MNKSVLHNYTLFCNHTLCLDNKAVTGTAMILGIIALAMGQY